MTTIAWDGTTLVADGLMCADQMIMSTTTEKILRIDRNEKQNVNVMAIAIASSGYPDTNKKLKAWLNFFYGVDSAWTGAKEFSSIVLSSHLVLLVTKEGDDPHISVTEITGPIAIGHGRDFAMGALAAGCSAEVAISVASQLDPYTGGEPTSFRR